MVICGGEACLEADEGLRGRTGVSGESCLSESSARHNVILDTLSCVHCSCRSHLHDHGLLRVNMPTGDSIPSRVTPYLIYLVFVTTLGPLQFGYHLVYVAGSKVKYLV